MHAPSGLKISVSQLDMITGNLSDSIKPNSNLVDSYARPTERIRSVIRHIYTFQSEVGQPAERVLLPNFQVSLIFNFGPPQVMVTGATGSPSFTINQVALLGPVKKALHFTSVFGGDLISVNFSYDGFYRFFNVPVQAIDGYLLHPDNLVAEPCFERLWEQLAAAAPPNRIAVINKFAETYVKAGDPTLNDVVRLLSLCQKQPHLNPVKLMADEQGVSERTAQLRFQKYVGFSPKEYARYLRFQRVLNELRNPACSAPDWYDFVEQNGYYDQSHLIHDFSHFVGQPPTHLIHELAQSTRHCTPYALARLHTPVR